MSPLIAIPAAGASKRMRGTDKLLEPIGGVALLRRQALAALTTGCPVVVTIPGGDTARAKALEGLALQIERVPDPTLGMSVSLRQAAHLLAPGQSLGILLPDVPGIETAEIAAILAAFRKTGEARVTRACDAETQTPGTPLFLPHDIALRLRTLENEDSGRAILKGTEIHLVPFPDDRAIRDLDTPEAWAEWRAETNTPN